MLGYLMSNVLSNTLYERKQVKTAIPKRRYGIESLREKNGGADRNLQHAV